MNGKIFFLAEIGQAIKLLSIMAQYRHSHAILQKMETRLPTMTNFHCRLVGHIILTFAASGVCVCGGVGVWGGGGGGRELVWPMTLYTTEKTMKYRITGEQQIPACQYTGIHGCEKSCEGRPGYEAIYSASHIKKIVTVDDMLSAFLYLCLPCFCI